MRWTAKKLKELRERYPHEDNAKLAQEFGCSRKALAYRAHMEGVKKTDRARALTQGGKYRKEPPETEGGIRREIATGTVIVSGHVLTHLSNFGAVGD